MRAFVLHFGERDEVQVAAHFAAIFLGFPVIVDHELPENEQIPNWYISNPRLRYNGAGGDGDQRYQVEDR